MTNCPACKAPTTVDTVDIGVGNMPVGERYCMNPLCDWEESGPTDFGFVGMEDRPFAPVSAEVAA
jgi:hypothetical protein